MTDLTNANVAAAERFVLANARLLERHRLACLLHGASTEPVVAALRAYRNPDRGFGHALEPDIRAPTSEPSATLHAFEVLAEVGRLDEPMLGEAAEWVASIAEPDGGIPFSLPASVAYPRAPFLGPPAPGGSMFTMALAGWFHEAGLHTPWLERATAWSWAALAEPTELDAYGVKCAIDFLDHVPDEPRALKTLERLRPRLAVDGSLPVTGGKEGEKLTPLTLSERPAARSRSLFIDDQIEADLERLAREQQDDGGWMFDFGVWSEGQLAEYRGLFTFLALKALHVHGRLE
ncbi:MAG TPA: hypothetical protein VGU26_09120 [Gaiellaceae bacterium]|nr:hypothetical protein [Gaiellaceae bacterium]